MPGEGTDRLRTFYRGVFTSVLHNILNGDIQQLVIPEYDEIPFHLRKLSEVSSTDSRCSAF